LFVGADNEAVEVLVEGAAFGGGADIDTFVVAANPEAADACLGAGEAEFAQAREQLKGGYILGLESASSRMSAIGRGKLLRNRALSEEEVLSRIASVTPEDVTRIARQILTRPCSIALVGRNAGKLDARRALAMEPC